MSFITINCVVAVFLWLRLTDLLKLIRLSVRTFYFFRMMFKSTMQGFKKYYTIEPGIWFYWRVQVCRGVLWCSGQINFRVRPTTYPRRVTTPIPSAHKNGFVECVSVAHRDTYRALVWTVTRFPLGTTANNTYVPYIMVSAVRSLRCSNSIFRWELINNRTINQSVR